MSAMFGSANLDPTSQLNSSGDSLSSLANVTAGFESNLLKPLNTNRIEGFSANYYLDHLNQILQTTTSQLQNFAASDDALLTLTQVFGSNGHGAAAKSLMDAWALGDFNQLPSIQVLPLHQMHGARGAYAQSINSIFLADQLLTPSGSNYDSLAPVGVLIEEIGHFIDAYINTTDTLGDEGELFSALVQGINLDPASQQSLRLENDHGMIQLDGQPIEVEFADVIESVGNTALLNSTAGYQLQPSGGSIIALKYNGSNVTTSSFSGWQALGAEAKAGGGYDVVWKNASTGQFTVWNVDANGNYLNLVENRTLTSAEIVSREPMFQQDLNSDGVISSNTLIESVGNTALLNSTAGYQLQPSGGSIIALKYNGSNVTTSSFSGWQALGAEAKAGGGYDVVWKNASTGQFTVWNVDANGNYLNLVENRTLTSAEIVSREPMFQQDLNSDGMIGNSLPTIPTITISANDLSAAEALTGEATNPGQITLTRTGNLTSSLTVYYTLSGTATNGIDYSSLNGSVTFAASSAIALINLNVIDDSIYEGDETVVVTLATNAAYTLGAVVGATVTIRDNESLLTPSDSNESSGNYSTPTNSVPLSQDSQINALLSGYKWNQTALTYNFSSLSNATINNIRNILENWIEPLINISFTETTGIGDIQYIGNVKPGYAYAYYPGTGDGGDVYLNPSYDNNSDTNGFQGGPGTHGFMSIIHETLHALGLKHSGNYDSSGSGNPPFLSYGDDNTTNTVMSYNFNSVSYSSISYGASTPMSYDIKALQYLYGAKSLNPSNTTYSFSTVYGFSDGVKFWGNTNQSTKVTIWDSSGSDTLDFSNLAFDASGYRFDLQSGGIVTSQNAYNAYFYQAKDSSLSGGKTTSQYSTSAYGTVISFDVENLINSTSNDSIYANNLANRFGGYSPQRYTGNDFIYNASSQDTLDLLAYSSVSQTQSGNDLVIGLGNNGSITVKNYYAGSNLNILLGKPTITITANDTNAAEVVSGQTQNPGQFTLTRTGSTTNTLTAYYSIGGTATNGSDYSGLGGSVTFAAGATAATINLNVIDDLSIEGNETVVLSLNSDTAYTVGSANNATVTIADNDLPSLSINDVTISEGNSGTTNATFTVTRTGTALQPITVNYATANNSATAGSDYTGISGTLSFATNETSKTISVPILGDTTVEGDETFFVNLSNAVNATLSDSQGLGTILNDDNSPPTVTVTANDANAAEVVSGQIQNPGQFTFTRTGSTVSALTIAYQVYESATLLGTSDYTLTSSTMGGVGVTSYTAYTTFAIGESTVTVTVNPVDDIKFESNETLTIALANSDSYILGSSNTAAVVIADNEVSSPFTEVGHSLPGVHAGSVEWGDYDNDGRLDILITGSAPSLGNIARIYRNTGTGFVDINAGLTGVYLSSGTWSDYDNDGRLDILITGSSSSGLVAKVYRNTGSGFIDINAGLSGVSYGRGIWGDYDNDGRQDILITGNSSSGNITKIYRNTGSGFVDINAGLIGLSSSFADWGDYDNDGRLDILLTGNPAYNQSVAKVYRNIGGGFSDINAAITGAPNVSADWGDYDNDGRLDILLGTKVYRNTVSGFTEVTSGLPNNISEAITAWGDYDNDGRLDILLTGGLTSKVYRNNGSGFIDSNIEMAGAGASSTAWGDYDNDGRLDLLFTGRDKNLVFNTKLYRNTTATANTLSNAPTGLNTTVNGTSVTLSWNKAVDFETPQNGLTYNLRVGTTPGAANILNPMSSSSGYRRVAQLGNVNKVNSWILNNLAAGTYYWSVQAVDSAFSGTAFATEGSFTITNPPTLTWARQLGTSEQDHLKAMDTDSSGNTYVVGDVRAALGGNLIGGSDIWLAKYNSIGTLQWTRQIGTATDDFAEGISVDGSGNVYLTGSTYGSFGAANAGLLDTWVAKYDTNGTMSWTRQLGTSGHDQSTAIVVGALGNVYVVGGTQGSLAATNAGDYDVWIAKYSNSGSLLWTRQFGTSSDDVYTSASDGWVDLDIDNQENIYISGGTNGVLGASNLGSSDAWLAKYDGNGNRQWLKQTGTSTYDYFSEVFVEKNSGFIYTLGTKGSQYWVPNWLTKYDSSGNQIWSQQIVLDPTYPDSSGNGFDKFFIDSSENIYLTQNSYGGVFLAKYSNTGQRIWLMSPSTTGYNGSSFDIAGIEVDSSGNIYTAGETAASFGATSAGSIDAWVAKYKTT
jgi:hypothetical protein